MELNVITPVLNAIKFVEDSTGMITLSQSDDAWEMAMADKVLRVAFRATDRIDQVKRETVTKTLQEQGWDVTWSDEHDDDLEPLKVYIWRELEDIYHAFESFLIRRVPPGTKIPEEQ